MTGHHEVQFFFMNTAKGRTHTLPDDWKPFSVIAMNGAVFIVARKWVRDEKKTKEEPST
jgi:hypothetical protein